MKDIFNNVASRILLCTLAFFLGILVVFIPYAYAKKPKVNATQTTMIKDNSIRRSIDTLSAKDTLISSRSKDALSLENKSDSSKEENTILLNANINASIKKLDAVLEKTSFKAKEATKITDKEAFLKDLNEVLKHKGDTEDISLYTLIDKKHNIGSQYVPHNLLKLETCNEYNVNRNDLSLRAEAASSLNIMGEAAKKDGITLLISSTYRSYSYQENLFKKWVSIDGLEEAKRESAMAGESQHQLGCAVDFGSITDDFADTKMGQWMYKNASRFGWSLSFPKGYEDVTGYRWECWHFRYIGVEAVKFQAKWFSNVQQFMLEFIDLWEHS